VSAHSWKAKAGALKELLSSCAQPAAPRAGKQSKFVSLQPVSPVCFFLLALLDSQNLASAMVLGFFNFYWEVEDGVCYITNCIFCLFLNLSFHI
jgi:hypothetical protein